jgi:hypothetical protein
MLIVDRFKELVLFFGSHWVAEGSSGNRSSSRDELLLIQQLFSGVKLGFITVRHACFHKRLLRRVEYAELRTK